MDANSVNIRSNGTYSFAWTVTGINTGSSGSGGGRQQVAALILPEAEVTEDAIQCARKKRIQCTGTINIIKR